MTKKTSKKKIGVLTEAISRKLNAEMLAMRPIDRPAFLADLLKKYPESISGVFILLDDGTNHGIMVDIKTKHRECFREWTENFYNHLDHEASKRKAPIPPPTYFPGYG